MKNGRGREKNEKKLVEFRKVFLCTKTDDSTHQRGCDRMKWQTTRRNLENLQVIFHPPKPSLDRREEEKKVAKVREGKKVQLN